MEAIFNKRSEGVKVYFSVKELKSKPIIFWNNVGNIHKYSKFNKWMSGVRKLVGQHTINGIANLSFYGGGRTLFPFHCNWMGDRFDFTLFDPFGNVLHSFSRSVKSKNERFTDDEIKVISKFMEIHSHIIRCGYEVFNDRKYKNYSDVFQHKKEIQIALNNQKLNQ